MSDAGADVATDPPPLPSSRRRIRIVERLRAAPAWQSALLAVLAYVPALTASPGRMPADSKLYLYLDPGRFLADAAGSFDPRQFGGWVPHQHIGYLWPTGPWFWTFEQLGVPDWIAHRLWIGTLMLAAGLGARWCARQLGLLGPALVVVAVVYQVSLYVLPYVSRTSVMLLPWCGLPWVVGLTVRASRRPGWRDPALIALVVFTVGSVNATALAMIVPAPALWLIHAVASRWMSWRAATVVVARVAATSLAVSMWWIVGLLVQGRHGAPVLDFSETLRDVASTSTSAEVWRSLGYWLFYIRGPFNATTSESLRYLLSTASILISFVVPVVCLTALVWVRWAHRRYVALLVGVGALLAVGVHPVDDRTPLMGLLTGDGEGGLALALRSSTRAIPMMQLGLALAAGSLVAATSGLRWRRRAIERPAAAVVVVLVVANMPSLFTGAWVDDGIDRDADPPSAWLEAAEALDEADSPGRVLMLPGAEFGSYRWGHTVDQPIPGLSERGVVTRDLLPLGAAPAMDLLYEFDDRFQLGVAEADSVGPVGRLFAADTIWLTNDHAFERYRTARPEVVRDVVRSSDAVTDVDAYGRPVVNQPERPVVDGRTVADTRIGGAAAPVELVALDSPGDPGRVYDHTLAVVGNGAGLVDAAALGLLSAQAGVRYLGAVGDMVVSDVGVLVTDTNRRRARQWATSQDTTGFTEAVDGDTDLLGQSDSDTRLTIRDDLSTTTAEQVGPARARATGYGEPVALLPEARPAMAIDGDASTAWTVGEHADPVGETIRIDIPDGMTSQIVLHQQQTGRSITQVEVVGYVSENEVLRRSETLDERSWSVAGHPVMLGVDVDRLEITITLVTGPPAPAPGSISSVGFAEIDLGLGPTTEIVRVPTVDDGDRPIAWLMTRERVDPMNRWRSDPEPAMDRELTVTRAVTVEPEYTVRLDARASDALLAETFDWPVVADRRLTGSLSSVGAAAFDGDPATAWTTPFDRSMGAVLTVADTTTPIDSITVLQPDHRLSSVTELELRSGADRRAIRLSDPDEQGLSSASVDPPLPPGDVAFVITGVDGRATLEPRFGDLAEHPVGIAEIGFEGAPRIEPLSALEFEWPCVPLATLDGRTLTADLRLLPGWADGEALEASPCEPTTDLEAGTHVLRSERSMFQLDRVLLDSGVRSALADADRSGLPAVEAVERHRFGAEYLVSDCVAGCWLVHGYGHNPAWRASIEGRTLGTPEILDGGFNGWWIGPTAGPVLVDVEWTAQRPITIALLVSAVSVLVVAVLAMRPASSLPGPRARPRLSVRPRRMSRRGSVVGAAIWLVLIVLIAGWSLLPWAALAGAALLVLRRRDIAALTAVATVAAIGSFVVVRERRIAPLPDFDWPSRFSEVHGFGMAAVASLFVVAVLADDARLDPDEPDTETSAPSDSDAG